MATFSSFSSRFRQPYVGTFGGVGKRWSLVWASAVGMLILLSLASPAEAGCSHYVRKVGPGFVPSKALISSAAVASRSFLPVPCNGPECRGIPPMKPSPYSSVNLSTLTQDCAVLIATDIGAPHLPGGWDEQHHSFRPLAGFRMPLNRPPNG